jgi:hypothetical protein
MGWLDTILGAATAGASIYNASQLQAMRQQGAQATVIQAFLAHLRDLIFHFKQSAEFALSQEARSAKVTAGALGVVESRLRASGITPDLFPDLSDKEYTAQTIRLIADNRRRLFDQLSPEERSEVDRAVAMADRLPDYDYYIANYADGQRLMEAAPTFTKYEARNGCLLQKGLSLAYLFIGLPVILGAMMVMEGQDSGGVGILTFLGLGVWIGGFVLLDRWQHKKEFSRAKKVVNELKDKIDLQRFLALDSELGGVAMAQQLQSEAQSFLGSFFGDTPMLIS